MDDELMLRYNCPRCRKEYRVCPHCAKKYHGLNAIQAETTLREYGFCCKSCRFKNMDNLRFRSTKEVVDDFLDSLGY